MNISILQHCADNTLKYLIQAGLCVTNLNSKIIGLVKQIISDVSNFHTPLDF